jgi:hypothetical protein
VAERLGPDIKTLMRTYAHVIRSDEDRVRSIVDESLGASAEDWLRTGRVGASERPAESVSALVSTTRGT